MITKKSNLCIVVQALEMGIPIIQGDHIWRLFKRELKTGMISSEGGPCYLGNIDFGMVFNIADGLDEGDIMNLILIMGNTKEQLAKGKNIEDLVFSYEDDFFEKMQS